jgi:uncharacterized RDD family membrane protein YckC
MRCPRCQGETGHAAIRCADCGAPLALPEEAPASPLDRPLDLDRRGPRDGPRATPRPSPGPLAPAAADDLTAGEAPELLAVPPPGALPPRTGVIELQRGGSVRRAAAWAVDGLPFLLATVAVASLLGASGLSLLAPLAAVAALASFTYQWLAHWLSGATLGKRLLGLRVVGPDGRRPGPGRSALRAGAAVAGAALLGAGPLLALFTRSGRALHDWVAGTSVVDAA